MNCTKCGNEMFISKEDVSHNFSAGKEYNRVIHACKECDTWTTVEVPKES